MGVEIRQEARRDIRGIGVVNGGAFGREGEARFADDLRDGGTRGCPWSWRRTGASSVHHVERGRDPDGRGRGGGPRPGPPVGVIPERQVRGLGSTLVREALGRCARAGHRIVVLLGHPNYYPRFRFSAGRARGLSSALSGEAFMTLELAPGALPRVAGEVEFAPPFGAVS